MQFPGKKFLQKFLCKKGGLTAKTPSANEQKDIDFGVSLAKEIGRLDIGQTVVVKDLTVVAVEAMEGTDQCLERAGAIAGKGCVMVKMAKPNQDLRFDVPVIGLNTIEKLVKIGAAGIAVEAGATLVLDQEVIQEADAHGLFIAGV